MFLFVLKLNFDFLFVLASRLMWSPIQSTITITLAMTQRESMQEHFIVPLRSSIHNRMKNSPKNSPKWRLRLARAPAYAVSVWFVIGVNIIYWLLMSFVHQILLWLLRLQSATRTIAKSNNRNSVYNSFLQRTERNDRKFNSIERNIYFSFLSNVEMAMRISISRRYLAIACILIANCRDAIGQPLPSSVITSEICNNYNARRIYLELGEHGVLHGLDATVPRNQKSNVKYFFNVL